MKLRDIVLVHDTLYIYHYITHSLCRLRYLEDLEELKEEN